VSKKTEKPRKLKKQNQEKKLIKPIKILKKPTGPVRFRFYKSKTEPNSTEPKLKKNLKKTEPNQKTTELKPSQTEKTQSNQKKPSQNRAKLSQNRAKLSQTEPNQFESVFVLKTEPNRNRPV
jgi:hypothetical protein